MNADTKTEAIAIKMRTAWIFRDRTYALVEMDIMEMERNAYVSSLYLNENF